MRSNKPGGRNLAGLATLASLVTCYGTLALVGVLAMLGVVIAINNAVWAGAIVAFAIVAVIALGLGFYRHRNPWPLLIGIAGAIAITYTMFWQYDRVIEFVSFVLLSLAALFDWRTNKALKQGK